MPTVIGTTKLGNYEYITDQKSLSLVVIDAKKEKYLGIDTENSGGLDVITDPIKLLLFQIEVGGKAYVVDARKVDLSPLKEILEDRRYIKIVQNGVYDYKLLSVLRGIYLDGIFDTKIAESILCAGIGRNGAHLEGLAFKYVDYRLDKSVIETFINFPYDGEFTDEQLRYAADDVLVLPEIRKRQQIYINQLGLNPIADIEFRLVVPVAKMELAGIRLDADKWRSTLKEVNRKLFKVSSRLHQVLPDPPAPPPKPVRIRKDGKPYANTPKPKPAPVLNLNSWQQLVDACSEVGIDFKEANKVTKAGLTNISTLRYSAGMYKDDPEKLSVVRDIIEYRGLAQTQKTFGENLLAFIRKDGRIHAKFNQDGTDSGRFSSSEPNLQNIQKKGEEGKILRSCFIPADNHKFIIADYSQIELRIAAELSGDERMLQILNDPRGDIHKLTAADMYGVSYEEVTSMLRRAAKTINFGLIYGMSVKTLQERIGCTSSEAAEHLAKYEETYPTLMAYVRKSGVDAYINGYSKTIGGRIRWFPTLDTKAENFKSMKAFYERVGQNHPIQGTSADMTKLSIIFLDRILHKYSSRIVNTIHDELCVEAPYEYVIDVAKLVKRKMIFAGERFLKKVPTLVEVKIRDCWFKDDGVDDNENFQQLVLLKGE